MSLNSTEVVIPGDLVTACRKAQQAAAQELSHDLRTRSPPDALVAAYRRMDAALSEAADKTTTKAACRAGCSFCCYYQVHLSAHEIFAIVDYVTQHFSHEQITHVLRTAEATAARIQAMSSEEHRLTNVACIFLSEGHCSIYPVRPVHCRTHHASEVSNCLQCYENPTAEKPNTYITEIFAYGKAHEAVIYAMLDNSGNDPRRYEFTTAFLEAMTNSAAYKRYRNGKKAFPTRVIVTS